MSHTMKKKTQKNTEIPNPFHERDADVVWREMLQNSKPISREEIIRRLGSSPQRKENSKNHE